MNKEQYQEAIEETRRKVTIHELINFDKTPDKPVKVSIVVPVCNVEEYLRECLDSAVNQTLEEIEIICVNDGSTDSSLEILKEYAEKDSRVKIIDKDNAGYGHAMNIGMDMACGEYIGIIESDDYADLHMYEDLYDIAKAQEVDFVKADFNRFQYEDGQLVLSYNNVAKEKKYYNRVINPGKEHFTFRFIMNTWSGIYKRDFLVQNGIRHQETPGASFQDNGFWFQSMMYAERIYIVDKPYYMNRRDNPNSSVYNKKKVNCMNEEYHYIYDVLAQDPERFQTFIGDYHLKKYHNYTASYRRIADEYRREYAKTMSEEFRDTIEKGELDESLFRSYELDEFKWIADDPIDYWSQHNDASIKVSVVIPVYNAAEFLPECLDSVLGQTLQEIEVICVDDASEDDSYTILEEYAAKDDRVRILSQEHGGGGAARNKGIDIARGEYISFLDADDFFEPDLLESIYTRCVKQLADVGVYRVKRYDNNTGQITFDTRSFERKNIPKKGAFGPQELGDKLFTTFQTWPWNKLFRRHFIEKEGLRYQEIPRTNDMYFVNTALMRAKRITALDRALVFYREGTTHNCQSTNHLNPTSFFEALLALKGAVRQTANRSFDKSFQNLVVRSSMYNLNSLKDAEAHRILYTYLHEEGLEQIGFAKFDEKAITRENRSDYNECKKIFSDSYVDYMYGKLTYYRDQDRTNEEPDSLKQLQNLVTARIDVKNYGSAGNTLVVTDIAGSGVKVTAPDWYKDDAGTGYMITAASQQPEGDTLTFTVRCVGDGRLLVRLRGMSVWNKKHTQRVQYWIDFTGLEVNSIQQLPRPAAVSHDNPYDCRIPVQDGDVFTVTVSFKPHAVGALVGSSGVSAKAEDTARIDAFEKELNRMQAEINALKQQMDESDDYKMQLYLTRESKSYKAGRALTAVPRKVRGDQE